MLIRPCAASRSPRQSASCTHLHSSATRLADLRCRAMSGQSYACLHVCDRPCPILSVPGQPPSGVYARARERERQSRVIFVVHTPAAFHPCPTSQPRQRVLRVGQQAQFSLLTLVEITLGNLKLSQAGEPVGRASSVACALGPACDTCTFSGNAEVTHSICKQSHKT